MVKPWDRWPEHCLDAGRARCCANVPSRSARGAGMYLKTDGLLKAPAAAKQCVEGFLELCWGE